MCATLEMGPFHRNGYELESHFQKHIYLEAQELEVYRGSRKGCQANGESNYSIPRIDTFIFFPELDRIANEDDPLSSLWRSNLCG